MNFWLGGFGDGFFSLLWGLFPVMFLLVLSFILFGIVQGLRTWSRNNHAPRLSVEATVVSRRSAVSHHHHAAEPDQPLHHSTTTHYYATFQVESGDRMEFLIPGREYGLLAEGDSGKLSFQGSRYLSFTRA